MSIISFHSAKANLKAAGGKGMNLVRLTQAGFPVPTGFIIVTDAYRNFVVTNRLEEMIAAAVTGLQADYPAHLEKASGQIRAAFSEGRMPEELVSAIRQAYEDFKGHPVAVRSSATTEDLPDLSFAGQQDTYLNILGEEALLAAVVNCWSSLWTARAIGYRVRNGIDHGEAALAVVVQEMVESEVSGVLFTANPLTGLLSESVIDATFGLGEALVSGQVEPDHFVVDGRSGTVISKRLGGKKLLITGKEEGGVETLTAPGENRQTLSEEQIRQLVALGQQVQDEYGAPQDIEWAFAGGRLYLLQSRAITSLFPVPRVSFEPLTVWFSFGAVQGVIGPLTPLGLDNIRHMAAGAGGLFGLQLKPEDLEVMVSAGERLWIKVSDVMRHPVGGRILYPLLNAIEPGAAHILKSLAEEANMETRLGRLKLKTFILLARFALPVLPRMAGVMLNPALKRNKLEAEMAVKLSTAQVAPASDHFGRLANVVAFMKDRIATVFPFVLPRFIPVLGPAMAGLNLLNELAENAASALEVTRSLPGNVTTEMDLALWKTATEIAADTAVATLFREADAVTLVNYYLEGALPPAGQASIGRFMNQYGMRGLGEIDLGRPRWREDPTPVMHTLQSYLNIEAESAPDVQFARGEEAAKAAVERLAAEARGRRGGRLKERAVRAAARRVRLLMGIRESPKFYIIRLMGIARQAILDVGREFVEAGTVGQPQDLFFLTVSELESLSRNEDHDWKELVAGRRAEYERESRRQQVPRVLVSDGRAFYEGLGSETDSSNSISGSPVSPGVVEGIIHVVIDPSGKQLKPGEILVCPGTDPAWTPLLMAASGLVTEVGGMMTHGSVVARELGIPAVVGVHLATRRLKDGQRVKLDGTSGTIEVINVKI